MVDKFFKNILNLNLKIKIFVKEYTSKRFASDLEFSEMLFKYLDYDSKNVPNNQMSLVYFINEDEQFDILIMLLGVLLNLFVNCFKQKTSINLLKCKNKKTNLNSIEIILNVISIDFFFKSLKLFSILFF